MTMRIVRPGRTHFTYEPDQLINRAGGPTHRISPWEQLDRFLILGTDQPIYHADAKDPDLSRANTANLARCLNQDGPRVVAAIEAISVAGRAPKVDPTLFALAFAFAKGSQATRAAVEEAFPRIVRTGAHLLTFVGYLHPQLGAWPKRLKRILGNWYRQQGPDQLAYQLIKYQQRNGWSHADVLQLAHIKPENPWQSQLFAWVIGDPPPQTTETLAQLEAVERIRAFEAAKTADEEAAVCSLIEGGRLPTEAIPTRWRSNVAVQTRLLDEMPIGRLVRSLGLLSSYGMLAEGSPELELVLTKLTHEQALRRSRIHPMAVLLAQDVYLVGHGNEYRWELRGGRKVNTYQWQTQWQPQPAIVNVLEGAFYRSFANVEPTGKRIRLCLDVSGSMNVPCQGNLTVRQLALAMALPTLAVEERAELWAFSDGQPGEHRGQMTWDALHELSARRIMTRLPVTPTMRLEQAVAATENLRFGGTDCATPFINAAQENRDYDAFVVFTDNEHYLGGVDPNDARREYAEQVGHPVKAVVVAMTATDCSIFEGDDSLNCVGCDAATPQLIADFIR
jgi:60 kDa SS-A/Ro ribonucleoprotein